MRLHCQYCGSDKHRIALCPKTWGGQGNRQKLRCGYCGGTDHNDTSCPKLGRAGRDPNGFVLDRR